MKSSDKHLFKGSVQTTKKKIHFPSSWVHKHLRHKQTNTLVCTYLVICDLVVKSRDLMDRKTSKQPRYCKETTKKTSLVSKACQSHSDFPPPVTSKWLFATSDTCRFRRRVDATKSNARRGRLVPVQNVWGECTSVTRGDGRRSSLAPCASHLLTLQHLF